jgi:hypothetical protein
MRSFLRATVILFALSSFPAVIWAFFHLLPLLADVFVLRRAAAYAPAVFEVEWARFDGESPVAVGTIDGHREKMALQEVLSRSPTGLNDLQDMMAKTRRITVLYDPAGTRTSFEGRLLRVLPETPDLPADRWRRVGRALLLGFSPAVLLVAIGLVLARFAGGKLGCWFFPSLLFLGT